MSPGLRLAQLGRLSQNSWVSDTLDPREGRGMQMELSLSPSMAEHMVWLATTWTCGSVHSFSVRRDTRTVTYWPARESILLQGGTGPFSS